MKKILLLLFTALSLSSLSAQPTSSYAGKIMQGISNNGKNKSNPYVAAGDRAYLIGTQDGMFPDMGEHIAGEMAGLWCPPFKLADGFWAMLQDGSKPGKIWLTNANTFTTYPYGNKLVYNKPLSGIQIERFQFCPDGKTGVLIKYTIKNLSGLKRSLKFTFNVKSALRPVWYTDTIDIDYHDRVVSDQNDPYFAAADSLKPWYLAVVSSISPIRSGSGGKITIPQQTKGKGVKGSLTYNIILEKNGSASILFALSGGLNNKDNAYKNARLMLTGYDKLLAEKKKHFESVISRSKITIPDFKVQEVYNWVKINTDWLARTVPGTGTGLTAGYMEYPWWFGCDNSYSLQGVLATGDFKLAKETLELLNNKSKEVNHNGRIVHEISTSGKVGNKGNTQETAHFIMCLNTYLKWTGDTAFIRKLYPDVKEGLNWLLVTMDKNKDMFPEGYGVMEVTGLNAELIDVAVYTQQALSSTADMAQVLNKPEEVKEYRALAEKLKNKINAQFWDDENKSYCDFFGSRQQALTTLNGSIRQLSLNEEKIKDPDHDRKKNYYDGLVKKVSLMPDSDRGWLTNKNWVINTPMEVGIAPRNRAIEALDKIKRENCGDYGPYLSATEKIYMMTIATGVQAAAECRYGRTDSAMWYVHKIAATFSRVMPGSISEMMPDFGCFAQAWTCYGMDVPLINYIFGINPDACHKRIILNPNPPKGWNNMNIANVSVGDNAISVDRKMDGKKIVYTIGQDKPNWTIELNIREDENCTLNGRLMAAGKNQLTFSGVRNVIVITPKF